MNDYEQQLNDFEKRLLRIEKYFPSLAPPPKQKRKKRDTLAEFLIKQHTGKMKRKAEAIKKKVD